jgi:hypothetical protein
VFLTRRLHVSFPSHRNFPQATTSGRAFLALDRLLDRVANFRRLAMPRRLRRPRRAVQPSERRRDTVLAEAVSLPKK